MKKIILILSMFLMSALLSAQVEYFVAEGGADTNDGLSAAAPLATFLKARNLINASHTATTDVTINIIGTVTDLKGQSVFAFNTADDVVLTVKGESAATSILQKCDDATWLEHVAKKTEAGRFFNMPQNKGEGNLTIIFEDITVKNFGHHASNGGMFINALLPVTMKVSRCNFKNGIARAGAIFQTNPKQRVVDFTMEDCFVDNMLSFNNGGILQSPIIVRGYSTGTFKNCVFTNCVMDPRTRDANVTGQYTQFGSVITFDPVIGLPIAGQEVIPSVVSGEVTNCTFINNGFAPILATDAAYDSLVTVVGDTLALAVVSVLVDSAETVNFSFNNNLVIGNGGDATNTVDVKSLVDVNGTLTTTSFTNNVMNSVMGFDATTCDTSAAYMYSSPEIVFETANDSIVMSLTDAGVMYVKAGGTSVFASGNSATATVTDITGADRAATPCVGAYEASELMVPPVSSLSATESLAFSVYPNPTSGLVTISDVEVASIKLFNQVGQLVLSTSLNNNQQLDLSAINNGLYILQVIDTKGQQGVQSLMVQ